jgi:hypothetical protein
VIRVDVYANDAPCLEVGSRRTFLFSDEFVISVRDKGTLYELTRCVSQILFQGRHKIGQC